MDQWTPQANRQLEKFARNELAQFVPGQLPKEPERTAMANRLSNIWKTYNSGKYDELEEKAGDPFQAMPNDVVKTTTLVPLTGDWTQVDLSKADFEHMKFTYPLRPDPKTLLRSLKKIGLCTAGNTMGLPDHEVFSAEVEADTENPDYWKRLKKPYAPPNWCFFLDSKPEYYSN
jgi:hypothetical protein